MGTYRLTFFGYPQLSIDGRTVNFGRKKAVALLAYLASTQGCHSREELATLLWGDQSSRHALGALRQVLMVLRRILGEEILCTDRETVCLAFADENLHIDTIRFRELSTEWKNGNNRSLHQLLELLSLYRGRFLHGFYINRCSTFEDWQVLEAEMLQQEYLYFLKELIMHYFSHEMYDRSLECGRTYLATDPWNEKMHRLMMCSYAKKGFYSHAIRQFLCCRKMLQEELQVSPSTQTIQLLKAIQKERVRYEELADNLSPSAAASRVYLQ